LLVLHSLRKFVDGLACFRSKSLCLNFSIHICLRTEVLNAAGVLDNIPSFSNEQIKLAESMKRRALTIASDFRQTVRKRVSPEQLKSFMESDRMATMGAAAGAFVGFML
jgi:hypothetical protein